MTVTRGGRCGLNPWQQHHHKARDALRSATKGERTFTSIWDTWQHDEIHRKPQLSHRLSDTWVRYLDHTVHFNISHNATQPQRERYVNLLHLRRVREAKKEVSNLQKSKREEQVLYIPVNDMRRQQNRLDPSLHKVPGKVEHSLGGTICRTAKFSTPTNIIIFKLVTKPNMVEFVFM